LLIATGGSSFLRKRIFKIFIKFCWKVEICKKNISKGRRGRTGDPWARGRPVRKIKNSCKVFAENEICGILLDVHARTGLQKN
jgi:hypothetical protein